MQEAPVKMFYSKAELAGILGVNQRTIDYYRSNKGLPSIKIERAVRFPVADFNEWVKKQYDTGVPSMINKTEAAK